jgi:hypothetical protein
MKLIYWYLILAIWLGIIRSTCYLTSGVVETRQEFNAHMNATLPGNFSFNEVNVTYSYPDENMYYQEFDGVRIPIKIKMLDIKFDHPDGPVCHAADNLSRLQ